MNDQKNLILAIVASVLIMVSFQYFYEKPKLDQAKTAITKNAQMAAPGGNLPRPTNTPTPGKAANPPASTMPDAMPPSGPAIPGVPVLGTPGTTTPSSANQVVISGPRVTLASTSLTGSITLKGAAFDDVVLKSYRETIDPGSSNIRLFAPAGGPGAYYANYGWISSDPQLKVPGPDSLWANQGGSLAPGRQVTLTWNNGAGIKFIRNIALDDDFMFTVTQRVENNSAKSVTLTPYAFLNRTGTPKTTGFYILHEGPLGVFDGALEEVKYDDLAESRQIKKSATGGWIGITDKYWLAALIPAQDAKVEARFLHWQAGRQNKYQVDFAGQARAVPPGRATETRSHLFSGAKEVRKLDAYSKSLNIANFDLAVDFGWFYFLTKPFFYLLDYLSKVLGNFGLSILAVTVLVKILFFPLANKSYKSMSQMKKLQPKMAELKEKYGDDKQRMNQEVMAMYKREKVNPASSCLPVLVQIPVFFALYKVLFVSIEMRHAPFYGWIRDLSAPDPTSFINIFGLLPFAVPSFIPDFISIGAWPIAMGFLMFLQMKLNPPPPDPIQARIFMLMPIFFTFIMAPFPAGLVIYWTWNNFLSISQQYYIMKRMEKVAARSGRT
jgi:YidC/Oxa1 family membrane protein insertase